MIASICSSDHALTGDAVVSQSSSHNSLPFHPSRPSDITHFAAEGTAASSCYYMELRLS